MQVYQICSAAAAAALAMLRTLPTCVNMPQDAADGRPQVGLVPCSNGSLEARLPLVLGLLESPLSLCVAVAVLFRAAVLAAFLLTLQQDRSVSGKEHHIPSSLLCKTRGEQRASVLCLWLYCCLL